MTGPHKQQELAINSNKLRKTARRGDFPRNREISSLHKKIVDFELKCTAYSQDQKSFHLFKGYSTRVTRSLISTVHSSKFVDRYSKLGNSNT